LFFQGLGDAEPPGDLPGMTPSAPAETRRTLLRVLVVVVAVSLIALWIRFAHGIFTGSQSMPAPAGIMLPVFFCVVALGAGMAALRGEGVSVALAGGISLVPMGLLLVLFPGSPRMIGMLDLSLIALGILLMRTEGPGEPTADADPDGPVGDRPPEPA